MIPQSSRFLTLSCLAVLLGFSTDAPAQNWGHWRGVDGNGVASTDCQPPIEFSATDSVRWKTPIDGRGSGSPVVWGDQVFVTTAAPTTPGSRQLAFNLVSLDRSTGQIRWQQTAITATPREPTHSTNTYASASPCTDGEIVYAFFGSQGLHAFTLDGKPLWSKQFGQMTMRNGFGEGASPTLTGDVIIVPWDHEGSSRLYALKKTSGKIIWQIDRDESSNWGTPLVVDVAGTKQVITTGQNKVRSYDLGTGELLWQCGGQTQRPVASPVAGKGLIFVGSGFRGSFLAAFDPNGRGNLENTPSIVWSTNRDTPDLASLLLSDDRLYFTKGKTALLSCVDAATGRPHYQTRRINGLRTLYASPIAAGGNIYITDRSGNIAVIKDDPSFEQIALNQMGEPIDATPAFVDNEIFLRSDRNVFCIANQ